MKYSCVRLYCVIHKNSLLLNQHNGDDAPQNYDVIIGGTSQIGNRGTL